MRTLFAILLICSALLAPAASYRISELTNIPIAAPTTLLEVAHPTNSPNSTLLGARRLSVSNLLVGVPQIRYLNFSSMSNKQPALQIQGDDGQFWNTVGPSTNETAISNGAWSVHFNQASNLGSHLQATSAFPAVIMWARLNYTNFNTAGAANPSFYFLIGSKSFDQDIGPGWNPQWKHLIHTIINNNTVTVQLWDDVGAITTISTFSFLPGWEVGGVSRLFGCYFGSNSLTFFGDNIGSVTVSDPSLNSYRPTNGAACYIDFEQYHSSSPTNVIWKINFEEVGFGNAAAVNLLMPGFKRDVIAETVQHRARGYSTQYGSYDAYTSVGNFTVTNGSTFYPSNSVTVVPTAASLGIGGIRLWNSNGYGLWNSISTNGTTVNHRQMFP